MEHHASVTALPEQLRACLLLSSQTIATIPPSVLARGVPERVSIDLVRSGVVEDSVGAEDGLVCALPPLRVAAPGSAEDEEVRIVARKLLGDHAYFASPSGQEQLRRLWAGRAARYAKDPYDGMRDVVLIGKATVAPPQPSRGDSSFSGASGGGHVAGIAPPPPSLSMMAPLRSTGIATSSNAAPAPNSVAGGFRFIPPPSSSSSASQGDSVVGPSRESAGAGPPPGGATPALSSGQVDIGLHNPSVSRLHAAIVVGFFGLGLGEGSQQQPQQQQQQHLQQEPRDAAVPPAVRNCCTWVVDLGSSNGTFVVVGAGSGNVGSVDFAAAEWYATACPQVVARLAHASRQQLLADARESGRLRLVPFAPFPLLGAACRRAFSTVRIGHASVELQIRAPAWGARFDEPEIHAAATPTQSAAARQISNPALALLAAAAAGASAAGAGGVRRDRSERVAVITSGGQAVGSVASSASAGPTAPLDTLRARLRIARGALDACPAVPPPGARALPIEVEQRRAALTRAVDELTAQVRALEAVEASGAASSEDRYAAVGPAGVATRRFGWRPNVL